jgi:hypothetical protein
MTMTVNAGSSPGLTSGVLTAVRCRLFARRHSSEASVASFSWTRLPLMARAALTVMAACKAAGLQEDRS